MTASDFGRDTSCTTGLRTGRYVTGARLVAEAAFRRLTTPRGMLRGGAEEADYGLDLLGLIGSVASKGDAAALEGRIQSELSKDPRIETVTATVLETREGPGLRFQITVEATTTEGPFTLVLAASDVTVEVLSLSEAT